MKKLFKFLLICIAGVLLLAYLGSGDEETQSATNETTQAAPATQRPNVEFTYGFKFVKLRVYSCKPCSEAQANSAAGLLAESGKVTAHAFFDMDDALLTFNCS